jgi:CHAT domain-containing protein
VIAGVLAAPFDQPELDVTKDQQAIENAVEGLNKAVQRKIVRTRWSGRPANSAEVKATLAEGADIFHLAAHAIFDKTSSQGFIVLEKTPDISELFSGEQLAVLLRSSGVRLAVLGACEGGRRDGNNVWGGIAPALFREGIPAVIGSQYKIADTAAILLAAQLYRRVLSGFTVDEALFEARESIYNAGGLAPRYWAAPVLYLQHPTGVLFPKEAAAEGEAGLFVEVMNELERVEGQAIGAEIESLTNGRIKVNNFVKVVTGTFIGARIGKL